MKKLNEIQRELKAPKGQYNSFSKFYYRSCEDILEAVKPLLGEATLTIEDEIVMLGDRFYVKATAILKNGEEIEKATAYAREPIEKKGMDSAQITGATSSYARKYALNGLFCIDDAKDPDTDDYKKNEKLGERQSKFIEGVRKGEPQPITEYLEVIEEYPEVASEMQDAKRAHNRDVYKEKHPKKVETKDDF